MDIYIYILNKIYLLAYSSDSWCSISASWWSNWSTSDATSDAYSAKLRKPVAPLQLQLANRLTFTVRIPHILGVDWFNSHIFGCWLSWLNPCLLLIYSSLWLVISYPKIPGLDGIGGRFTGTSKIFEEKQWVIKDVFKNTSLWFQIWGLYRTMDGNGGIPKSWKFQISLVVINHPAIGVATFEP
jgi:hypothetical protein